jgi:biotin transport system permease protein
LAVSRPIAHPPAPTLLKLLLLSVGVVAVGVPAALAARHRRLVVLALFVIAAFRRAAVAQIAPISGCWFSPCRSRAVRGWLVAGLMAGRLVTAVALAALFTLTTT